MKMTEPTHIHFDGQNIIFSENLSKIAVFLIEIDKEVQSFLARGKQVEGIRKQMLEWMDLIKVMAQTIKDANLDFSFKISENPSTIADKLKFEPHPRSEMIVLFAYLETLRCLWMAYDLETDQEQRLRDASDDSLKRFYQQFCLSKTNQWISDNPKISGKISKDKLCCLRNSLTHFFSVAGGLCITSEAMKEDSKKLMNKTNNQALFISTKDLFEIVKGASLLLIQFWSDEYQKSLDDTESRFEAKIKCVNSVVQQYGAVFVSQK